MPDAQELINEMSQASRSLNYDGVFIYRKGNQIDTIRLVHKMDEDGEHERLVSLSGNAREVIRDKDSVRCVFPDNRRVFVGKSRIGELISSRLPNPIESVSSQYTFSTTGQDRIADKNAWIVNITPKDDYRYGYQLWIDQNSKLLLKFELKNKPGITLEQIMFVQIKVLDTISDHLLEPSVSTSGYTLHEHDMDPGNGKTTDSVWKVTWIPDGFSMSASKRQVMDSVRIPVGYMWEQPLFNEKEWIDSVKMPVDHMVFSDGLATVSIFVEQDMENTDDSFQGASRRGGVNAFAVSTEGYHVTAVGEVPMVTVKLMASSVKQLN